MCTGRIDMSFIFRALLNGADGVFVGGCRLNECNYITHGNFHALNTVFMLKKVIEYLGLSPERLRIEFMTSGEANVFIEAVSDFVRKVKELGPLGRGEGIDDKSLKLKLEAAAKLVPYFRLVENERLRVHFGTVEEYRAFYAGEELAGLFRELIADKLAVSQIVLLLRERPRSTTEISELLGLTPSEISRHLNSSSKQGLVSYDASRKHYALALPAAGC
jgi:F420-non-reducing hydrogenase iron-sulfur subunit